MSTQPLNLATVGRDPDAFMQQLGGSLYPQGQQPGPDAQTLAEGAPMAIPPLLAGVGGATLGMPGAGLGSSVGNLLKSLAPSVFGEGPKDVSEALTNIGTDVASQGVAGKLGNIAEAANKGGLGGAIEEALPTSLVNKFPGVQAVRAADTAFAKSGQDAVDAYHQDLTNKTKALQDAYTNESLAEAAHKLNSVKPEPIPFADTEKPDVAMTLKEGDRRILPNKKVEVLQAVPIDQISGDVGNKINEGTVQAYQKNAYNKPGQLRDNPDGGYTINEGHHRILADVRNGKNSVLAWTPEKEVDTETAFTNAQKGTKKAQDAFDTAAAGGPNLPTKTELPEEPSILSATTGGKFLLRSALAGAGAHMLGMGPEASGLASGVVLTFSQIAKLAKSPQLGAAIIAAQKTPASAASAGLINKLILHSLVGESVDLPDGSSAKVGSDGVPR